LMWTDAGTFAVISPRDPPWGTSSRGAASRVLFRRAGLATGCFGFAHSDKSGQGVLRRPQWAELHRSDFPFPRVPPRRRRTELQQASTLGSAMAPHGASALLQTWLRELDLNQRHTDYETVVLPG
jgi:hypothetical protein